MRAFMLCFLFSIVTGGFLAGLGVTEDNDELIEESLRLPTRVIATRAYGGRDETLPPVFVMNSDRSGAASPLGESEVTIEIDVQSEVTPSLFVQFSHCNFAWQEDDNIFLNDITLRTSNIEWSPAAIHSRYFTYRGILRIPNIQIKFRYSGNWKAKIFDYDRPEQLLGEVKFYIVEPVARCELSLSTDFYDPQAKVSPIAISLDAEVSAPAGIFDDRLHSVVFYRNHRWAEPMVVSVDRSRSHIDQLYGARGKSSVFGFAGAVKRFSRREIPAQNAYRLLDLADLTRFPITSEPIRPPFADLRRNGSYDWPDDDGALITRDVFASYDDYVPVEFVLDPEGYPSRLDVFLVGTFNHWNVSPEWQMYYDEHERLYKLRQWIRRGRHNYLYATGELNVDSDHIDAVNFEEFEGNTLSTGHTFIAFVYYREVMFGGYDAIVGIGAANIFGSIRR